MTSVQGTGDSGIAIIGMSGRFPGAPNVEEYWHNLRAGVESISRFTATELAQDPSLARHLRQPNFVMAHGMLTGIEYFDHLFFDYPPVEAELIDPQQRVFLEEASAALEAAGCDPERFPGLIGVYAGISTNTYQCHNILAGEAEPPDSTRQFQIMVANDKDYLATRVSYKLNLKGPSYTLQTACSTSLVAIHAACQSLLTGECAMALAGGVTLRVPQVGGYLYEEGMVYSKDGRVRSFDAAASGTVMGSGVGVVVLKPLAAALADGDVIHAVIRGSATNNDGSFKASYAAPSREGQARVILEAQALADVDAESITYVEAHATGTLLGDPVEVAALTQAFRQHTAARGFCAIGSVKANVGHLDSAAGVAGLMKVVLMLQHRELVPTVGFETPNPSIDFPASPFYVSDRLAPWNTTSGPRRAAVSSFGVGGTNAHVILEEAPARHQGSRSPRAPLLVLSAKTPVALEQMHANLDRFLQAQPDIDLWDVASTLGVGRRAFRHRRAVVIRSAESGQWAQDRVLDLSNESPAVPPPVVILLPTLMQVRRHVDVARVLYETQPVFRESLQTCEQLLTDSRQATHFTALERQSSARDELRAGFAIAQALASFWMALAVAPEAVTGSGLGQLAAAVAGGALTLPRAIQMLDALAGEGPEGELFAKLAEHRDWAELLRGNCVGMFVPAGLRRSAGQLVLGCGAKQDFEELPGDGPGAMVRGDPTHSFIAMVEESDVFVRKLTPHEQVSACVARLWAAGVAIDWEGYYSDERRLCVVLPTYPFARYRHWIEPRHLPGNAVIHPLVHENVSTFEYTRFLSRFTGHEFFFRDHVVSGQKVLPGVAYLEMVRTAVEIALGRGREGSGTLLLKNVVWMTPLAIGEDDRDVWIDLRRNETGWIEFSVSSRVASETGTQIHSQGLVAVRTQETAELLDLAALRAHNGYRSIDAQALYARFAASGLEYGRSHRGVINIGWDHFSALAQLHLPTGLEAQAREFCLHPSIMDAALQATAVLAGDEEPGTSPHALPFELAEMQVFEPCIRAAYAHVRRAGEDGKGRKLDIDLCDEGGRVCVRLRGFSTRRPQAVVALADYRGKRQSGLKRYIPVWNPLKETVDAGQPAVGWVGERSKGTAESGAGDGGGPVLVIGASATQRQDMVSLLPTVQLISLAADETVDSIFRQLASRPFEHLIWIAPETTATTVADEALLLDQQRGVVQMFRIIKALISLGYGGRDLRMTLLTRNALPVRHDDRVDPTHAGVHGLAGSLAREYEHWSVRVLDLQAAGEWPFAAILDEDARSSGTLAWRGGEWLQQELVPVESVPLGDCDFKAGGVYVIVGGAGGIGTVLSRYLAQQYRAKVVWIGRRPLDQTIRARIDASPHSAPAPCYIRADAADRASLEEAYTQIKHQYGSINGVIHSAIVLADKSLANMPEKELLVSLSAKVAVSVRIAQVFGREPLDFVLFLSSIQSFTRSPGQANYAAGCVFEDAFARGLERDWPCAVKTVNWSFWGATGVVDSAAYRERMAAAGIESIEPQEGMEGLVELMRSALPQIVLFKGPGERVLNGVSARDVFTTSVAEAPSVIEVLGQFC